MTASNQVTYKWGVINPAVQREDPRTLGYEPILPPSIAILNTPLGIADYTVDAIDEAMVRYDDCVRTLVGQGAQSVSLTGIPISVQLGRKRVLDLMEHTERDLGVPGDAAMEAAVDAMKHLNVSHIAVGSRWPDEINQAVESYLNEVGIEAKAFTTRGQWHADASAMSLEMGIRIAFELGREAMRKAPDADGLLLPGGAWRPLAVIPSLEEDFGVPVFTNDTTRAWRFIHDGLAPPLQGWGKLLATP